MVQSQQTVCLCYKDKLYDYGYPENQTDVIFDNTKLDRATKTEFLGVMIGENLTWKNHIDGITKTISRNICMISKLNFLFLNEYCTLILPYVNYGIFIWGQACRTYLDKIHKLQKWALRIISNSHYRNEDF